jgi:hypothetical protein
MEGSAVLQNDFSYMISPNMFRRWVLPALEEEAQLIKHALYHWDGPGALVHFDSVFESEGLFVFGYVPESNERHTDHMDLFQRIQSRGKAVQVWGTTDEMKCLHRELRPELHL